MAHIVEEFARAMEQFSDNISMESEPAVPTEATTCSSSPEEDEPGVGAGAAKTQTCCNAWH